MATEMLRGIFTFKLTLYVLFCPPCGSKRRHLQILKVVALAVNDQRSPP